MFLRGHRSVDFMIRRSEWLGITEFEHRYHFLHSDTNPDPDIPINARLACYFCIIQPSNIDRVTSSDTGERYAIYASFRQVYYTAIGRERHVQRPTIMP